MDNNITTFIEQIKIAENNGNISPYDLYMLVKDNEKLLQRMCEAVMTTYGNLEHIKKFIG